MSANIDRIEGIEPVDKPFRENKKVKPDEFFQHTIGITHNSGPVEDIVLWFSRSMGNYIKTQHLHPSQEVVEDTTDGLIIKLKLSINYELTSLLLSYVPDVAVLEPSSLRDKFKELLMKGLEVSSSMVKR